jgi:hypothetical protein
VRQPKADAAVTDSLARVGAVRSQMGQCVQDFATAVTAFLEAWYRNRVERAITNNPELVLSRGVAGVRPLKNEFKDLMGRVFKLVEAEFSQDKYWIHGREDLKHPTDEANRYHVGGTRVPDEFDAPIRRLMGEIDQILAKHRFGDNEQRVAWESDPAANLRYKQPYDCPEPVLAALRRYHNLIHSYTEACHALRHARKTQLAAEARNLWDQA